MNMLDPQSARTNRILGALPMSDYLALAPHLEPVQMQAGQVVEGAGTICAYAHFPVDCAVTMVSATRDGEMSELALIGREGVVGLPALLGAPTNALQSVVLRSGLAYRLPAPVFAQALQQSATLQSMAMRYVQNLMLQMAQGVVCSLHHSVLQRLSTWLLYHHKVTASEQVKATHETIAQMLGVRRESITQAAGQLQQAGCLSTSRGRVTIHDPQALQHHVCECYGMIEREHQQLWQMPQAAETELSQRSTWRIEAEDVEASLANDRLNGSDSGHDHARYADIYDFAPVGLLSLDSLGRLIETNMAAAIQLGISRSQSRQYRFVDFLQPESREDFERFHREVLSGKCRRHCEVSLMAGAHTPAAVVRLDATADESGEENRMVMVDITDSHRQMAQLLHSHGPGNGLSGLHSDRTFSWTASLGSGPGSSTGQSARL